jgi:hypothetical protein
MAYTFAKNQMKYLLQLSLVLISLSRLSAMTPEEADAKLKASINENRVIVDICIYEQQWISPNNEFPKGRLIKRAVVTEVYKGTDVALGAKLEFDEIADEFPGKLGDFTSPVEGDLRTLFSIRGPIARGLGDKLFFGGDLQHLVASSNDGKDTSHTIQRANNWTFPRTTGVFADAFKEARKDARAFSNRVVPPTK